MDKNMINIDDLLRQRLGGGEEKERPGAWLQMRDLLDKEMPVQRPGTAFNWRRMLGVVTGVIAISAVGLGGYQAVTSFRNGNDITNGAAASSGGHTASGSGRLAQIAANSEQSFSSKVADPATPAAIAGGTNNAGGNGNKTGAEKASNTIAAAGKAGTTDAIVNTSNTNNQNTGTANTAASDNNAATANVPGNKNDKTLISNGNGQSERTFASTAGTIDKKIKSVPVADNAAEKTNTATEETTTTNNRKTLRIAKNNKAKKNTASRTLNSGTVVSTPTVPAAQTTKAATANKAKAGKATNGNTGVAKTKPSANNNTGAAGKPAAQVTANNTAAGKGTTDQNDSKVVIGKESIAKVETRESYTKEGKLKIDTISVGTIEREIVVAAAGGVETASSADNTTVPASAATPADEFKGEVAPASKTRRKKEALWTPKKLEEMVRNTRISTNEIMFYPGIVAGANTTLGGIKAMPGFQVGLSGTLSLNERWGIFTELKYVHRLGGGTMETREIGPIQQIVQNNQTTYKYTPTLHQYTLKSISALELPVAVRYKFQRISLLMGVNYAYYFSIANTPSEVIQAPVTSTTEPTLTGGILTPADFSPMHGLGYMAGIGYHVSPAMHFDARFMKPMFSSVNTPGAKEVSNNVFSVPTIQVNFNYNFIREKKIK